MDKRKAKAKHNPKPQPSSKPQHTSKAKRATESKPELRKLVLLVLMALLLLAPTLASACGLPEAMPDIAINENRNRLKPPAVDVAEALSGTGEYFQKWDSYYNDGFGTRDLLIRIKNQLNYSLFNYTPDLFTDGDGNMYYYNVVANEQIANEKMEDHTPILDKHAELAALCQAKGITYVFFYAPQKNTVFRPELSVKRPTPVALERFYAACENDPRLKGRFVNIIETLRAQTIPVFPKYDFHWNDYGAALGFGEVVNHLAALEGLGPLFKNDVVITEFQGGGYKGGQLDNLSILTPAYEKVPTAQKATPVTSEGPDYSIPTVTSWTNRAQAPLGTALVVGDSYTPLALFTWNDTNSGICDYFTKVYYTNHNEHEPGFLSKIPDKIDYLIFENIEVGLTGAANYVDPIIAELSAE